MPLLKGWIGIDHYDTEPTTQDVKREGDFLHGLGVQLGSFDGEVFEDCEVDDLAMDKLNSYWGRFYWGLYT
jgi:hypothetical protein